MRLPASAQTQQPESSKREQHGCPPGKWDARLFCFGVRLCVLDRRFTLAKRFSKTLQGRVQLARGNVARIVVRHNAVGIAQLTPDWCKNPGVPTNN